MNNHIADDMVSKMVSAVLYGESSQDKLVELIWDTWTDEQKKSLADEAHRVALERVGKIVESRLYHLGSGANRVNLFARYVGTVVHKVFQDKSLGDSIEQEIHTHYQEFIVDMSKQVRDALSGLLTTAVHNGLRNLTPYEIQSAIKESLKEKTE